MKNKNGFRKMMAWVLALILVLGSVCAVLAEGETPEGNGSEGNNPATEFDSIVVNEYNYGGNNYIIIIDDDGSHPYLETMDYNGLPDDVTVVTSETQRTITIDADIVNDSGQTPGAALNVTRQNSAERSLVVEAKGDVISETLNGVYVDNSAEGDLDVTVSGEVKAVGAAVSAVADADQASTTVTVKDNISANGQCAIAVDAGNGGSTSVTAEKDVTATGNNDSTHGIGVQATDGTATVTVKGKTEVASEKGTGVFVEITKDKSNTQATIETGDINAKQNGIVSEVRGGATSNITSGKITVEGTGYVTGIAVNTGDNTQGTTTVKADSVSATTTGIEMTATGVKVTDGTVIIGEDKDASGDITAKATVGKASAIGINASGSSDVTITGNVTAEGYSVKGVAASDKSTVTITGNVTTTGSTDARDISRIGVNASGGSNVTVTGNVKAGGSYADGISASGISSVTITGNVTAEGKNAGGVIATENASVTIAEGDIIAQNTGISVRAGAVGQNVSVGVRDGDVISTDKDSTNGIRVHTGYGGKATVMVAGDVTSNNYGLTLSGKPLDAEIDKDILIEGTLSGKLAVELAEYGSVNGTKLTVWEAKSTGYDTLTRAPDEYTDKLTAGINYIVKTAAGLTNSNISTENHATVKADWEHNSIIHGDETEEGAEYDYHTANEGENVILSAQLDEGVGLDGVYYNAEDKDTEGKVNEGANLLTLANGGLTKLDDGSVLLKMLFGGGMLLGLKTHTHDFSEFVAHEKEPTCTETGVDVYKCKYCNATITETVATNPNNHTLANGDAKAVTCTEDGWEAYQYCTRCSYSTKKVIEASGHDFEDKLTAGAKTHWYACKNCDAKKGEAEHTPGEPVKEKEQAAQAGEAGSYEEVVYCTVCGAEISRETILGQDAIHNPNAGEADIAEYESMTGNDIDLNAIPMPMDVSSDDDDVKLDKLANCPDALKETAKQELAALKRSGYKIDCGCVAWSKSGKTAACTLKLSEKDVPDGAQIFVNGAAVQAEQKDGYYYFEITLPAVVLVAHK